MPMLVMMSSGKEGKGRQLWSGSSGPEPGPGTHTRGGGVRAVLGPGPYIYIYIYTRIFGRATRALDPLYFAIPYKTRRLPFPIHLAHEAAPSQHSFPFELSPDSVSVQLRARSYLRSDTVTNLFVFSYTFI